VRAATRGAAQDAAEEILTEGRADIQGAPGNWGSRWPESLQDSVTEGGGNIRINVWSTIPYFNVFEYGATIKGHPLLWIPFNFAPDAIGVYARNFPQPLFCVDRVGKAPLLMGPWFPGGIGKTGEAPTPKYFGKEEVTIPQKFHIRDIVRDVARRFGEFYKKNMK
jgi:hypothetical protein